MAAIRAAAHGQTVLMPEAARAVMSSAAESLTAREAEVLQLMAAGRRNAEIAQALAVSVKTIEFHVGHILDKLGARSRTEALVKARQQGLGLVGEPATGQR